MPILEVELLGQPASFEVLGRLPMPNGLHLEGTEASWALKESDVEPREHADVTNRTLRLIEWLNAFGAIVEPSYQPVREGAVRCGSYVIHASFGGIAFIRDREFVDANTQAPPALTEGLLAIGLQDLAVRDALHFYATSPRDGYALYKVLEVIRKDVGGKKRLGEKGWITPAALESLRESLDSRAFAGDLARHGRRWTPPPETRPISLPDVEECIRRLLLHWLAEKARPHPQP